MISENEQRMLNHIGRWGSDGYPIQKRGRGWVWGEFFGIQGPNKVFKTKREAFASFEAYYDILLDKKAGRL